MRSENENKKNSAVYIRITGDDLERVKEAARIKRYASYTEYIRRTILLDADATVEAQQQKNDDENKEI